jgi:hypothetical protein
MPEDGGPKAPEWLRKAAIAKVVEQLLSENADAYLTSEFGLQPKSQHVRDVADVLYEIATADY